MTSINHITNSFVLGVDNLGGQDWGNIDLAETKKAFFKALDIGINSFDTADIYGLGESERILSKLLGARRHSALIVSKFGVRWSENDSRTRANTWRDISPEYMNIALNQTLKRLRIDALPLYLVHWPDMKTDINDVINALENVKKDGKILNYGFSNFDLDAYPEILKSNAVAYQSGFNVINKRWHNSFKIAKQNSYKTMAHGPLAQGLLAGVHYTRTFDSTDRRSRLPFFKKKELQLNEGLFNLLFNLSQKYGKTCSQISLKWLLQHEHIDQIVFGASKERHVIDNVSILDFDLEKEEFKKLEKYMWKSTCD